MHLVQVTGGVAIIAALIIPTIGAASGVLEKNSSSFLSTEHRKSEDISRGTRFFCDAAKLSVTASNRTHSTTVIRWLDDGDKSQDILARCHEVSQRFETHLHDGSSLHYITIGEINGIPAICAVTELGVESDCENFLFLIPPDASSSEVMEHLITVNRGSSVEDLYLRLVTKQLYQEIREIPDFSLLNADGISHSRAESFFRLGLKNLTGGDLKTAVKDFRLAIRVNPNQASFYNNWGVALARLGKLSDAVYAYQEAIQLNPNLAQAHNNLGTALGQGGNFAQAIKHYRQAVAIQSSSTYHYNLATALMKEGELDEAVFHYQSAVQLEPNLFIAHAHLGDALIKIGKVDEAITAYRNAVQIQPDYLSARNGLGFALQKQGNLEAAITQYEWVLALSPSYGPASNNLREARRLLAHSLLDIPRSPGSPCSKDNYKIPDSKNSHLKRSIVLITIRVNSAENDGGGTGFVIARRGNSALILTNHHVINTDDKTLPVEAINVEWFSELSRGEEYCRQTARLLQQDEEHDLALIEVANIPDDVQPLTLNPGDLEEESEVSVIGHPAGALPWSVVSGTISNTISRLQISANVSNGNSGSPIFDDQKQVIGILTQAIIPTPGSNATGGFGQGYSLQQIRPLLRRWNAME